ncbi:CheA signal transduction histidine kinase [Desulfobulbus propionicus DSM 2032]|jgi:two-component system chemotaxis sensor kinase CheA|uniref:histidine kinase n=1 Tax=Desulfobulbus propionicus (strain ATCC 33891 / DSM 2032 / VKM B-1956 / 1pr3) TaxID=577650 RepID=A0A7U3YM71_DESPD|nr:chemotaxis protein CheW [Desulfobulbus propionicus]ADW17968.1 CheA signal transduction histidine kinase [Desulfobulbus propionicus DSM 2032]
MSIEDDEILQGFIEESLEHLADIENDLLAIEEGGADIDVELVNKVFRAAHSIKGGAGFMGLTVIQDLAHAAENVLGLIRSGKLVPNPDIINVLLLAADELQHLIEDVGNSNSVDISRHTAALNAIFEGGEAQPAAAKSEQVNKAVSPSEPEPTQPSESIEETTVNCEEESGEEAMLEVDEDGNDDHEGEMPETTAVEAGRSRARKSSASTQKPDTSIRVTVSLLDQLMNLAGELVLSRNQLLQTITSGDVRNAEAVGQRIDLVTSELQEAIMLTRMQPIGNVFNKFPRVVRDLSKKLGKQIDLTIVGKDVELDKTIIEAINDPLTHLVRNSVDHGIEAPEERIQKGKDVRGLIVLKAYHAAGQVVIEISDDGKGIDGNMLAETAVKKGLITADQAKVMSEKERINLILLPGFSTAKKVTDVSGRGVGMDVVKTNLDQLGGSIEIESEVGKGSTISIKLPLTLAIIPCQIVMTGGERYAIPQVNLEELLRIPASKVKERVERVGDAEVVRLRGNLLPLIRMAEVFDIDRTYYDPIEEQTKPDRRRNIADRRSKSTPLFREEGAPQPQPRSDEQDRKRKEEERRQSPSSALNIVVVSTGAMKYGLIVDRLHDSEEIVIKPLGRHLQQCQGYAGATIMGDGRIALILDVSNIARMAGLTSLDGSERATELAEAAKEAITKTRDKQALLTFSSSAMEQFGVPLNQVERVEKIKRNDIEEIGGRRVMQYRGGSLPLISIDEVASVMPLDDREDLLVIVFRLAGKDVGLLAIGPIDAIEISAEIDDVTLKQPGIMGSAIIGGKTTMLVNIFEIMKISNPQWFEDHAAYAEIETDETQAPTILIVEDSNFFRNQVKGYMEEAGFNILEAEDGKIAWDILQEHGDSVTMVVTDIEMPNMDGFTLTEKIKGDKQLRHTPVIALTTLAADEDIARGKAVGVDEYHIKLDKERLMESVHRYAKAAMAS